MSFTRQLSLGRIAYQLYYRPKAALKAASRRGFINSMVDQEHHRQMRRAAGELPCLDEPERESVRVHYLTGERFWHQTAFCAWTLSKYGKVNVVPVLHDDGTLDEDVVRRLRRTFPKIEVKWQVEAEQVLDRLLPRAQFPNLRGRRDVYPNLKKLTDVHVGETGWKLVLDSDMLFFRAPTELLDWLRSPNRPCHMVDSETSYGYPLDFLSRQCGASVQELVNVGITGLCSERIPWEHLEQWTAEQIDQYGAHYYQEQALIAQLVAADAPAVMPAGEYVCQPSPAEVLSPVAALHHYVASSKPGYYRHGWRHCLRNTEEP
jgi:hypothetical protein